MTVSTRPGRNAPRLGPLQRWFFDCVTSPSPPLPGAGARRIVPGGLPPAQRIEVYRHGYFARLAECLADDYPAVAASLGSASFDALCRAYIEAHPPPSASLNCYGAGFAELCRQRGPALAFQADLARLEWAVVEAIHADATRSLDAEALGALDEAAWSRARLVPSPTLRILFLDHSVYDYHQAFSRGERPAAPERAPSALAVCRRGADVWRLRLTAPVADLLARLAAGEPLASALEVVSGVGELGVGALERAFGEWVACGCFATLVLG